MIDLDAFFTFEPNITYQVQDLPDDLSMEMYAQIRKKVFERHLATCDKAIQESWAAGEHPSFDWNFADRAYPFLAELAEILQSIPDITAMGLGLYHMNQLVISVSHKRLKVAPERVHLARQETPWFYKGFAVLDDYPDPKRNNAG